MPRIRQLEGSDSKDIGMVSFDKNIKFSNYLIRFVSEKNRCLSVKYCWNIGKNDGPFDAICCPKQTNDV